MGMYNLTIYNVQLMYNLTMYNLQLIWEFKDLGI